MNLVVCKTYKFSAAHHLPGYRGESDCGQVHGHTFWAEVYATGPLGEEGPEKGMVVEYARLTSAWREIEGFFDHADLNETDEYPTTERIAALILREMNSRVTEVFKIRLWEGPGQFAEVSVG